MATISVCDICRNHLDREAVTGIRFSEGAMGGTETVTPHFVVSGRPTEQVVCESCADYFSAAIRLLIHAEAG